VSSFVITVLALAAGVYLYLLLTGFFTERAFMSWYRSELLRSASHAAALQAALRALARRAPFNTLSLAEIEHAGEVLAAVLNPRAVARIVRMLDRGRDARLLADEGFLRGVVFTHGQLLG
jgi:hypothetical protein